MTLIIPAMDQPLQGPGGGGRCRDHARREGTRTRFSPVPPVPPVPPVMRRDTMTRMDELATGFIPGTMLRTPSGDVAVENLGPGDCVLAASGEMRRICWIGLIAAHPPTVGRRDAYLVHVAAHACAQGRPARDLQVLPDMAMGQSVHDEVLVPARELTNGATIATVPGGVMECWGIVLDRAAVVLANGLPVGVGMAQARPGGLPRILTRGPLVAARRAGLAGRAQDMGWRVSTCMDVHAMVDGRRLRGDVKDGVACFIFPATARHVRVVSRTFVPADWAACDDRRALGLAVRRISLGDGMRMAEVDPADPRIAPAFHAPLHPDGTDGAEGTAWRWTRETLSLPCALWRTGTQARGREVMLRLEFDAAASQCWVLPAVPVRTFHPDPATLRRPAHRRRSADYGAFDGAPSAS
ncbi:Hint domain-containing protein [Gluconacetobacter entanii]|uniref:Hint domain-containing protein n=1 Tax=Gluconacetobacter entanii TaxID=108528 RepID=A0ABT3K8T1_9PROT|nr:Hint domain-containing protein [Gluconacetobacter entanii]MCW4591501.1 Hint domain-containing protein [Gluconacetobacter entanii]MCW4593916.1 Hint domain-containing protein [Gluconacetobacter entanii]